MYCFERCKVTKLFDAICHKTIAITLLLLFISVPAGMPKYPTNGMKSFGLCIDFYN
jgi:hypothetical protein